MTRVLALSLVLTGCSSYLAVAPHDHVVHDSRDGVERNEWVWQGTREFRLFARSWRAADAHAVLVIVHGLRDHSARYDAFATSLAQRGYAVYAYDHRGHGRSDGQGQMVDAFDDYLLDLTTFVSEVRRREPGRPVFLFGHSMGGAIATLYAETRDPEFAGVVLSAPALRHHVDDFQHAFLDLSSVMFPYVGLLSLEEHDFTRDPEALAEMQHDPLVHHESGPARTAAELLSAIGRLRGWFDGIRVPVLVVHGLADRVTMPEGSDDLIHGATSAPDRTLWRCDGMFHDLLHEPEHAALGDAIFGWMESRREGPRAWLHTPPPEPCHDATPVALIPTAPAEPAPTPTSTPETAAPAATP
jgi:alpha-beta hydrolase superfamily lysophospholipase